MKNQDYQDRRIFSTAGKSFDKKDFCLTTLAVGRVVEKFSGGQIWNKDKSIERPHCLLILTKKKWSNRNFLTVLQAVGFL